MATAATINGQPNNFGIGTSSNTVPTSVSQTQNGTTAGSGTSNTSSGGLTVGSTSQNTTSNSTQKTNSTTQNMTSQQLAELQSLISALMGGGTPEFQAQVATRKNEQTNVDNLRQQYSKSNAFIDAQGLISQQFRRAMESMLPAINRAAEDAGSSGGALRALLLQDAADKAAESSSALGVQTATQYGGIAANLSSVLEGLTRVDPTVTNALVNALNIAKGSVSTTNGTVTTNGSQQTTGTSSQLTSNNSNTNTTQNGSTTQNTQQNTTPLIGLNPTSPVVGANASSTAPVFFGPVGGSNVSSSSGGGGVGFEGANATAENLAQLWGTSNSLVNNVTF